MIAPVQQRSPKESFYQIYQSSKDAMNVLYYSKGKFPKFKA